MADILTIDKFDYKKDALLYYAEAIEDKAMEALTILDQETYSTEEECCNEAETVIRELSLYVRYFNQACRELK